MFKRLAHEGLLFYSWVPFQLVYKQTTFTGHKLTLHLHLQIPQMLLM